MSIIKVQFSSNINVQASEMWDFMSTYAEDYFDTLQRGDTNPGDIVCTVNLDGGKTSKVIIRYNTSQAYATMEVTTNGRTTSGSQTLQWDSNNQTEITNGYVTSKGFALQVRSYGNGIWLFVSKTEDGETIVYLPKYSYPSLNPKWMNLHRPDGCSQVAAYSTTGVTMFTNSTPSVAGLCPLVTAYEFSYSPYLHKVVFSGFSGLVGKMTMNGIDYVTNGMIALQD